VNHIYLTLDTRNITHMEDCNSKFDWKSQSVGNIVLMEHINIDITDQSIASIFYLEGLGLTRDPYKRIGTDTMWVNVGYQQFHLISSAAPQIVGGTIGIVVPDLGALKTGLSSVQQKLKHTKFAWHESDTSKDGIEYIPSHNAPQPVLCVTGPWGNKFKIYNNTTLQMNGNLGIIYIELSCAPSTAKTIFEFYRSHLGAIGNLEKDASVARIVVGPWQQLIYRETPQPDPYDGWHVAIYISNFGATYNKFANENLLLHKHNFMDTCKTVEEAYSYQQFRLQDIPHPTNNNKVIYQLQHEVRSMYHFSFKRPLVNRFGSVGIFCNQ